MRLNTMMSHNGLMFADLGLAKRLEKTEGRAGASFVCARGEPSAWRAMGGAYVMFDGADSPLTQTFGLGLFEEASEQILEEIEEFYFRQGSGIQHEVCPLSGVALSASLAKRGYLPVDHSSVLFLEIAARQPMNAPADVQVRLAGQEDNAVYARKSGAGWADNGEIADVVGDLSRVMAAAEGFRGFLAEQQGGVIATAGLIIHDDVALLAGASTLPHFRGRGAQAALLAERLRYADANGCDLAMMVTATGSTSQRNAERLGFRIAYTRTKWSLSQK